MHIAGNLTLLNPTLVSYTPEEQASAVVEQDVAAGVSQLDSSFRKIPGYAVKVAEQVEKHGINALAYERSGNEARRAGNWP